MRSGAWTLSAMRRAAVLASAVVLGSSSGPAVAHHGWSQYGDEEFTLSGVVGEVYLGNPHGELKVSVDGKVWNVVLGPPFRNQRAGIEDGVIELGDDVTAYGNRHRDEGTLEMKTQRLEVGDKAYQIY